MIRHKITQRTTLSVNESYDGETIEHKVHRIMNNGEAITDGAPLIYTERKDGVRPEYNIRTDRWEIANEAMNKVHKTEIAKRQQRIEERDKMKVVGGKDVQNDSGEMSGDSADTR